MKPRNGATVLPLSILLPAKPLIGRGRARREGEPGKRSRVHQGRPAPAAPLWSRPGAGGFRWECRKDGRARGRRGKRTKPAATADRRELPTEISLCWKRMHCNQAREARPFFFTKESDLSDGQGDGSDGNIQIMREYGLADLLMFADERGLEKRSIIAGS